MKEEWVNKAWGKERGIETIDYDNILVLVRASVEEVARAFAHKAVGWEQDMLGQEVVQSEESLIIFRLRGHSWTEILHHQQHLDYEHPSALKGDWAKALSRRLKTQVITYSVSDSVHVTGYSLIEAGEIIETFEAMEGDDANMKFFSKRRPLTVMDIDIMDMWDISYQFFLDYDTFDPGISFDYFFSHEEMQPGQRMRVQNPGFICCFGDEELLSRPEIERVDYVTLAK